MKACRAHLDAEGPAAPSAAKGGAPGGKGGKAGPPPRGKGGDGKGGKSGPPPRGDAGGKGKGGGKGPPPRGGKGPPGKGGKGPPGKGGKGAGKGPSDPGAGPEVWPDGLERFKPLEWTKYVVTEDWGTMWQQAASKKDEVPSPVRESIISHMSI